MEAPIKNSKKRRLRSRKRRSGWKIIFRDSKSPSRNLGIKKPMSRKEIGKNMKKIRNQYLGPFIEGLCKEHISLNSSQEKGLTNFESMGIDPFDQTIDLCEADGSTDNCSSNVSVVPSCEVIKKNEPVIDLCQDLGDRNEIIDLTETASTPRVDCKGNSESEPTIIDISEDDSKDDHNFKPENDEVCVLGTFSKNSNFTKKSELPPFIPLLNKWNNFNSLITSKEKWKKKHHKKRLVLDKIDNKNINQFKRNIWEIGEKSEKSAKIAKVGENIYVNSPVSLPSKGLRPIIIDGSNVAFVHSNSNFSCKRLETCINYFKERGHKVTAFVPQFRLSSYKSDNPQLLRKLERQGDVVLTPSKKVDGKNIVPYDDRFIVQTAVLKGGIIVSRDNYNDLLKENPAWAETIKYRTLAFTWVDDVLIFPKDPLGEYGPTLEDFLRFH